ncbi:MAG: hypothetical protein V7K21_18045 [Nostoc sp.]|uniref:hypothetical protein n=1 Tax=Nostoc sp. TaxID=1180 RepID=UPI002FF93898
MVTSFEKEDAKLADDIKIDGFIQKPFNPDAVIAKVRTILDQIQKGDHSSLV